MLILQIMKSSDRPRVMQILRVTDSSNGPRVMLILQTMTCQMGRESCFNITGNDSSDGPRVMLILRTMTCRMGLRVMPFALSEQMWLYLTLVWTKMWLCWLLSERRCDSIWLLSEQDVTLFDSCLNKMWLCWLFVWTRCDSIWLFQCNLLCLLYLLTCLIDSGFLKNLWNIWTDGHCWYSVLSEHDATLFDSCNASSSVSSIDSHPLSTPDFFHTSGTYGMIVSPDIPSFPNTIWLYLTLEMHPPLSLPSIPIPHQLRIFFTPLGLMEWLPLPIFHHFRTRYDYIWLFAMHPPLSLPSIPIPHRLRISFTPLGLMEWLPLPIFHHFRTWYDSIWLLQCILLCLFHRFTSLVDSGFLSHLWDLWNDCLSRYSVISAHDMTLFDSCNASSSVSSIDSHPSSTLDFFHPSGTYGMIASSDIPLFPNTIWLYLTLAMHPPLSLPLIHIPHWLRISFTPLGLMEWLPLQIFRHFRTRYDFIWLLQCILLCLFHWFTSLIDSGFLTNLWDLWNDGPSYYPVLSEPWCDCISLL